MKKYLVAILFLSAAGLARAQDAPIIKPVESTQEEILGMLRLMGARSYRFDMSELSGKEYSIRPFFDEYVAGEKAVSENELRYDLGSNWRQRFPNPERWNRFLADKNPRLSADGQKYLSFENMGLYVVPKNDSTVMVQVSLYGGSALSRPLKLRTLETAQQPIYNYIPFKIHPVTEESGRIPLLLVGSFWWDENIGTHRFCTVREFEPDLSDKDLEFIPHYYVIGIEVSENQN